MQRKTIRISESPYGIIREISRRDGMSMQAVLEQAIEVYRRQTFLEGLNAESAALRVNDVEWQAEKLERAEWDVAMADDSY